MKRRAFLIASWGMLLSACTATDVYRGVVTVRRLQRGDVGGAITTHLPSGGHLLGSYSYKTLLRQLLNHVARQWGDQKLPRRREVVKYTDHYRSRALIDFAQGAITVETQSDKAALQRAIVLTLLAPEDPSQFDLFSAAPPKPGRTPFLYQLVVDHTGKPIRWRWRAQRFAAWLIRHKLQRQRDKRGKPRLRVTFAMVDDFPQVQQGKYAAHVLRHSRRYKLDPALIWAIMAVESSFNPWAVSRAPAYGLMQIVPHTAGRDVYRFLHGKDGMPTPQTLFVPAHNIEYGCTYLHLLNRRYLAGIAHPLSREYCMIAAYNTGAGNVLRAFDRNRHRALKRINRMGPQQVYRHLRTHLSHSEARRYVQKVVRAKARYRHS